MAIQARLETLDANSRRSSPRRKLRLGATLGANGEDVVIHDLSSTGVLLQTSARLEPFDNLEVDLPEVGATQAFIVWHSGDYFGCEFARPINRAAISAALLRNPISAPLRPDLEDAKVLDLEDELPSTELGFSTKLRVILGAAIVLWAAIFWAISIL